MTASTTATLIPLAELCDRALPRLPANARPLLKHACKDERADALGLWIDAWPVIVPTTEVRIAVIVFAQAVTSAGPLVMRSKDLIGATIRRNQTTFVFLEAVTCSDFLTVPETLTILARGLEVRRVAVFDGGDAQCTISGLLRAPYVVAARSGVGQLLAPVCVDIGAYTGLLRGLPRGTKARKTASLAELFPLLTPTSHELEDNTDAWEMIESRIRKNRRFCELAFNVKPTHARRGSTSTPTIRVAVPKATLPKATVPAANAMSAAERKLLFRTRSFANKALNKLCSVQVGTMLLTISKGALDQRTGVAKFTKFKIQKAAFKAAEAYIVELLRDGYVQE